MKKFIAILVSAMIILAAFSSCAPAFTGNGNDTTGGNGDVLDGGTDNGGSQNGGSQNGGSQNGGSQNGGSQNGGTDNGGSQNGGELSIPEGISASDLAKLILAGERLNSSALRKEGDIFDEGAEALSNLIAIAENNLNSVKYQPLASHEYNETSRLEINGNNYKWIGFNEYNNSLDYFQSVTNTIIESAKRGADLIDNVKKNVRVVDKWVDMGQKLYLHVEENSELLIAYDENFGYIDICKRYINEDGQNVYEIYYQYENHSSRMFYIPGVRYEHSTSWKDEASGSPMSVFVADHSKGFWETYSVVDVTTHYNISCFMMKDDICYDALYAPDRGEYGMMKIMSADRKTAMLNIHAGNFEINLSGFDGIESVEITTDSVAEGVTQDPADVYIGQTHNGTVYAQSVGYGKPWVNLKNGKTLTPGSYWANGKVYFERVIVAHVHEVGNIGELTLRVEGETHEEQLENLKVFLDETGLVCRRDINETLAAIKKAYSDCDIFVEYYRLNGLPISTEAEIAAALLPEYDKMDVFRKMFEDVKDAEAVDLNDIENFELSMHFADISEMTLTELSFADMSVTVSGLELTVEDTLLFVEGEPYTIRLGLVGASGIVHLEVENESSTEYERADSFTVTSSAIRANLPLLEDGVYELVAYIATADGVRSSGYITVADGKEAGELLKTKVDSVSVTAQRSGDKGEISVAYAADVNITIDHESEGRIGYTELYDILAEEAFKHGTPGEKIEVWVAESESFVELSAETAEIEAGLYRIAYTGEVAGAPSGTVEVNYSFTEVADTSAGEGETTVEPADTTAPEQ